MKRSIYSGPDEFSLAPMLSLLPVRSSVGNLAALHTSLFARYEKVKKVIDANEVGSSEAIMMSYLSEEAMLRQVLDWLLEQA